MGSEAAAAERLWARVGDTTVSGCRPITRGSFTDQGYAQAWDGTRLTGGHRFAWRLVIGPIPTGLQVLHHCDNPPCVHIIAVPDSERVPDHPSGLWTNRDGRAGHLWLGTNADNVADKCAKGRAWTNCQGERNRHAKLTADDVLNIRQRYSAGGISQQAIADAWGLKQTQVSRIVRGEHWKHLT